MRLLRGSSSPPYPFSHSGTCIVSGYASCLHEDLRIAWDIFPNAGVIAVNAAAKEVKATALFSFHPEKFISSRWIEHQKKFGDEFTVHAMNRERHGDLSYVQYWWPPSHGGGSAWGARKLAWLMGFDTVILCGCPMIAGPYVGNHGIGGFMTQEDVVENYRREIREDTEWHEGCFSMSGATRDILGYPC